MHDAGTSKTTFEPGESSQIEVLQRQEWWRSVQEHHGIHERSVAAHDRLDDQPPMSPSS